MKKLILFAFAFCFWAVSSSRADVCVPSDPDFDSADCLANGGTVGSAGSSTASGGGPGGGTTNQVPIDGGLSIMLAIGGALGARRAFSKKKTEKES
jgi:hypothetical protein